jgi:hypothetical protein
MSTRDDASLTAKLASRLRGSRGLRLFPRRPAMPAWVRSTWWGIPALVVGLALVILSISVSLVLGVAGAVLAAAGLWLVIRMVDRRWLRRGQPT